MSTVRTIRRRVAALAVALGLVGAAGFAAGQPATGAPTNNASTLTIGIAEHGATLNPFTANLDPDLDAINLSYPTLDRLNEKSEFAPYLADSWTTSSDKLTWTFHLHKGLDWSDGQPITANDVAWTFNLIMHNTAAATANGALVTNFASVTAPDANTVVFITKKPQANMLLSVYIPIVPEHIWKSRVASIGTQTNTQMPVVGYGPFQITGFQTDQDTTFTANKKYFLGAPKYHTLVFEFFKNIDAAVAGLRGGQVDQVDKLTATEYQALQKDKGIFAYQQVADRWTGVEINPGAKSKSGKKLGDGNPILADQRVRTAIAYSIDRATLVKKVLNGLGQPGAGYLPPAFPDYFWQPSASQTIGYDPAKAKQLLTEAGYPMGPDGVRIDSKTKQPLSFRLGIHSDDVNDSQIANYLVGWLQDVGIKVNVQSQSNSALNDNLAKGDWDMLMDGWGTSPDPTYLLSIQTCGVLPNDQDQGGQTDAFYCNPQYDNLFNQQTQEFDQTARSNTVRQMQQLLYTANDDIILYYQNRLTAIRTDANKDFVYGSKDAQGFYPYQNYKLSYVTAVPPASSSSGGSSNTGLIIGIVVAVVVIAGIALLVVMRRRGSAADRA